MSTHQSYLARGLTFNIRRGGEVLNLKLTQSAATEDGRWKKNAQIYQLEDPVEKKLVDRLEVCYPAGQKKKSESGLVPITEELVVAIKILVNERENNWQKIPTSTFSLQLQVLKGRKVGIHSK